MASLILDEKKVRHPELPPASRGEASRAGVSGSLWDIEKAIKFGTANATAVVEEMGAKNGLLMKGDFEKDPRWKNLEIKKIKI